MNIYPITSTVPACYGVTCPQRKDCQRYYLVESTDVDKTISTCMDGQGNRPHFVRVVAEKVGAA